MPGDANFITSNVSKFPKGTVVVAENDPASKGMFVVLHGSVGVYKNFRLNNETQVRVLSQGSFWGEMALFLNKDHDLSLVSLTDSIVLTITRRNVYEFFAKQSEMAFNIFENICRRLDAAETEIRKTQGVNNEPEISRRSKLFPEGHGAYTLPLANDNEALYEQKVSCPLCGQSFTSLSVISTRLKIERTDADMRTRYKDVEPLYYEIITCPNCFFSAQTDTFSAISKKFADSVNQKVGPYKLDMYVRTGMERDTFTVFAGYYLAILCAESCLDDYQMTVASLWQKLSRLYQDCGDDKMFLYAGGESLKNYLYSYENFNIPDRQLPQFCFVIGDLYMRQGDVDNARTYYYNAKINPSISNVLKRQADIRLDEIKALKKSQQQE